LNLTIFPTQLQSFIISYFALTLFCCKKQGSMKIFLTLLVAGCWLLPLSSAAEVVDLTDDSFEHQTQAATGQTTGKWLVEFYAPWCGHCKTLAPVWDALADSLDDSAGIVVAKVDCTENRSVCQRFGVTGYPNLKFFADGQMFNYQGARSLEPLEEFVLGVYKNSVGVTVPPKPSWVQQLLSQNGALKELLEDFNHIVEVRKSSAIVLVVIGVVWGVILSTVYGMLMGDRAKKEKKD
jgi:thioredoxin domain-containing protein 5